MENYHIYEVVYHAYSIPEKMDEEEIYKLVTEHGDWYDDFNFTNESRAWEQWEKSADWAETGLAMDYDGDEYFYSRIMIMTIVINGEETELDYRVESWKGLK